MKFWNFSNALLFLISATSVYNSDGFGSYLKSAVVSPSFVLNSNVQEYKNEFEFHSKKAKLDTIKTNYINRKRVALSQSTASSSDQKQNQKQHVNLQPEVAKIGGRGDISTSQLSIDKNLNLGSPQGRPSGGHYLTRGGVQITSNITPLEFVKWVSTEEYNTYDENIEKGNSAAMNSASKIEELIDKLDSERGVLLSSSYEFPGRYKRWSMGFVNPPLEISGKGNNCQLNALNDRGKILIPAVIRAMNELKDEGILESVNIFNENGNAASDGKSCAVSVHVTLKAMSEAGSFDEESRSRQVCEDDVDHIIVYSY